MRSINRRDVLVLGSSSVVSLSHQSLAWAAAEPDKKTFMKGAIKEITRSRKRMKGRSELKHLPIVVPFGDWDYYFTLGVLDWQTKAGDAAVPVNVPSGFVTDLASVPRLFWSVFPRTGRYAYAAIAHDYLYWMQDRPRDQADNVLELAMKDSKVSPEQILAVATAARVGGQSAWDDNSRLKKSGEKRFLKKMPGDEERLISWAEWKKKPDVFAD
jgi:hypothetical protein